MKVTPFKQNLLFRNLLLLSAKSLVTLTYLSSSQNFPRVSDLNERMNPLLPVPIWLALTKGLDLKSEPFMVAYLHYQLSR